MGKRDFANVALLRIVCTHSKFIASEVLLDVAKSSQVWSEVQNKELDKVTCSAHTNHKPKLQLLFLVCIFSVTEVG